MKRNQISFASAKLERLFIALLLLTFVSLATVYSFVTPAFETPDEPGHFYYISHLITDRTLPHQIYSNSGEAHQPPLYYLIASFLASFADVTDNHGVYRLNPEFSGRGGSHINVGLHGSAESFPYTGQALALHLARIVSVLMGAATVASVLFLGWRVFPEQRAIGWLAAILTAFNPQFLFLSGSINNDNLLILLSTIAWLQVLRTVRHPEQDRHWLFLGVLAGAGLLTKLNGLLISAVAGLALFVCAYRQRSFRRLLLGALEISIPVVLITGWWFIRNQQLYGDPLGWNIYTQIYAANQRQIPFALSELVEIFRTQFFSFWGVFGWMNVWLPFWIFNIIKALLILSAAGWVIYIRKSRQNRASHQQKTFLTWIFVIIFAQELLMLLIIQGCNASCYQGRYLFPAIGPIMILLSLGLMSVFGRYARTIMPSLILLLIILAASIPFLVIKPAYPSPVIAEWRLWTIPNKENVNIDDQLVLKRYKFRANKAGKGNLTLYWQILQPPQEELLVNVQFIGSDGQVIDQRTHIPGKKLQYPPTNWWFGDIIIDQYSLNLPQTLPSNTYQIQVSVSNATNRNLLSVIQEGKPKSDYAIFDLTLLEK